MVILFQASGVVIKKQPLIVPYITVLLSYSVQYIASCLKTQIDSCWTYRVRHVMQATSKRIPTADETTMAKNTKSSFAKNKEYSYHTIVET